MSHADDVFMRQFGVVLGLLVLFSVVVYFIAKAVGGASFEARVASPTATAERIAPVGSVVTSDAAVPASAPAPATAAPAAAAPATAAPAPAPAPAASAPVVAAAGDSAAAFDGQQVYQGACLACHATGAAGAPKLDDAANWAERAKAGMDTLLNSVLNGKGAMPPKGGRMDLEDGAIKAAVQYMLSTAGVEAG